MTACRTWRLPNLAGAHTFLIWQVRELLVACTDAAPHDPRHWETRLYLERKCGGAPAVCECLRLHPAFRRTAAPSSFGTFLIWQVRECLHGRMCALRDSTAWEGDASALDEFAEVHAHLITMMNCLDELLWSYRHHVI